MSEQPSFLKKIEEWLSQSIVEPPSLTKMPSTIFNYMANMEQKC